MDINIPADVVAATDADQLIRIVSRAIASGSIRLPMRKHLGIDPRDLLKNKTGTKLQVVEGLEFPAYRREYAFEYTPARGLACVYDLHDYESVNQITDLFTEDARNHGRVRARCSASTHDGLSMAELWAAMSSGQSRLELERIVRSCVLYAKSSGRGIGPRELSGSCFVAGPRRCTNFKVSVAEAFFKYFEPSIVFDPFSGWGDRAIGAIRAPSVREYYGCDPNPRLREGYDGIEVLGALEGKLIMLTTTPVETYKYETVLPRPDMIFTSPPFYDLEDYDRGHQDQSIVKYPAFSAWSSEWFIPQFLRQLDFLKPGGHCIYYITNVGQYDIIGPMIDAAQKRQDIIFDGCIPNVSREANRDALFFYVFRRISTP